MAEVELFIVLLAGVVALVALAHPLRVPYPVVLVAGGLVIGLVPFAPGVRVEPDLVFLAFLPPILYAAAYEFADEDVRPVSRSIGLLAVGLVLVTMAVVAAVAHWALGLGWTAAFILGAVLSPTDPVAATSVIRRAGAPQRITVVLEGEALVNDGVALTAFRVALGVAAGEAFSAGGALLEFAVVALGGIGLGAVLGRLLVLVRRRMDAAHVEITMSLLLAYGAFAAAEQLGVSGILATVMAGYVVGRGAGVASPHTRIEAAAFWSVLSFVAESTLFVLLGLSFADVLGAELDRGLGRIALESFLIAATVLGVRFAWCTGVAWLPWRERLVVAVSGMRGGVSVAAALAIPAAVTDHSTLLLLTCGGVLLTLVPAGVALPLVLRATGLGESEEAHRRHVDARVAVAHAALQHAERAERAGDVPRDAAQRAREAYEARIAQLRDTLPGERDSVAEAAAPYRQLRREMLRAEREALEELGARREVTGETRRAIERELDLEETRLSS